MVMVHYIVQVLRRKVINKLSISKNTKHTHTYIYIYFKSQQRSWLIEDISPYVKSLDSVIPSWHQWVHGFAGIFSEEVKVSRNFFTRLACWSVKDNEFTISGRIHAMGMMKRSVVFWWMVRWCYCTSMRKIRTTRLNESCMAGTQRNIFVIMLSLRHNDTLQCSSTETVGLIVDAFRVVLFSERR